eukprot:gb/GEZN01007872.1/.p1 GENE.gb/GEZN01007872.1/~~gb/GEZN01007872.1/.p1  ORF type:complete len:419 (+),score=78.62 gb/GEZN01007872.1/:148-1404(+)
MDDPEALHECFVCSEEYDGKERCPRVLTCGHSLCHNCASSLTKENHSLVCPFDNRVTKIPDEGLPVNRFILTSLEVKRGAPLLQPASPSRGQCAECETCPVDVYCKECDGSYCQECGKVVHRLKLLRYHTLVAWTERPEHQSYNTNCPRHPQYPLDLICTQEGCLAKSEFMCLFCERSGVHKGHASETLEEKATPVRQKVEEEVTWLVGATEQVSKLVRQISKVLELLGGGSAQKEEAKQLALVKASVRNHFQQERQKLDQREKALLKSLDEEQARQLDVVHTQQLALGKFLSLAHQAHELGRALVKQKDHRQVVSDSEVVMAVSRQAHEQYGALVLSPKVSGELEVHLESELCQDPASILERKPDFEEEVEVRKAESAGEREAEEEREREEFEEVVGGRRRRKRKSKIRSTNGTSVC